MIILIRTCHLPLVARDGDAVRVLPRLVDARALPVERREQPRQATVRESYRRGGGHVQSSHATRRLYYLPVDRREQPRHAEAEEDVDLLSREAASTVRASVA